MELGASIEIERPVADLFRFYADKHVENHPRWDSDVELKAASDGPLGVGSVIHRRLSRFGRVVEGTMEVTEFDRDRAFAVEIHDGPTPMFGRATFEALSPQRTRLKVTVDAPAIQDPQVGKAIEGLMQRSVDNIRRLTTTEP